MFQHGPRAIVLQKSHFAKIGKNGDTVSQIVWKLFMLGTIPLQGYQMSLLQTFW